jgi:6-phosphofructokinase 1
MNAAIRAVVRVGIGEGCEVLGICNGYAGLVSGEIMQMGVRSVGGIIHLGGTVLGSARCPEFGETSVQLKALDHLCKKGIEGLIVIGGNGSQTGAHSLSKHGFPVMGVASTIDNDLYGSEITIGVDTALNIALEAIDRLKVTAASHHRTFLVEGMGRDCGFLALMSGIAGGAEAVVIPEMEIDLEAVCEEIKAAYERGKPHAIVVVAEGAKYNAAKLAAYVQERRKKLGFELRVSTLGHIQRGGSPGAFDRLLGTGLGGTAVKRLIAGERGKLVGYLKGKISTTPLDEVVSNKKEIDPSLFELARVLAR